MHRRRFLAATTGAALSMTAVAARAQPDSGTSYDYLFMSLKPGAGASGRRAFLAYLSEAGRKAVNAADGEVIGVFSPQLGWDSNELAVLIRWSGPAGGRDKALSAIGAGPQIVSSVRHRLAATIRPQANGRPLPGGIYVHRWFEIKSADLDEFLRLSGEGWIDFEKKFATNIFGLFAELPPAGARPSTTRLLLLTRYADHAVWEASRDPSTEGMKTFARRQQMTLSSKAASTLLAALPNP